MSGLVSGIRSFKLIAPAGAEGRSAAAFSALCALAVLPAAAVLLFTAVSSAFCEPAWISPNRCRLLLSVDPRGVVRKNSPASVNVDLQQALAGLGVTGEVNEDTIEVVAYDGLGRPVVFDSSRTGYEKYLLPWRITRDYGMSAAAISFVMPDHTCVSYAVYFDTLDSGRGRPDRYPGIVGDGDWFSVGYGRREINANKCDAFCDFDGDGDLDLFKANVEPYVYCYENVGGNRYVDRGRLTSGGVVMTFPHDGVGRSSHSVMFCDWDNDGDQDMFIYALAGANALNVVRYENITQPGGPVTFADPVRVLARSGQSLGSEITFVDWDGDGRKDVLGSRDGMCVFYRNVGTDSSPVLADGVYIRANGVPIELWGGRFECADIDSDGDLDMFGGTVDGKVYLWTNVGTRTEPVFTIGRIIAFYEYMDLSSGVKVADFDGDGLLDFVVGRLWERVQWGEQPRFYGCLYKNVGTPTSPKFEIRDAYHGSPYTERFQRCHADKQNGVRAVDWDNDGRTDLIASDTDGYVWWFRNLTNQLFPIFAEGQRILAGGAPLRVWGELREGRWAGYARTDVCDWNNDGKKDLLVADGRGYLWLYLNVGTDAAPVLAAGTRVCAYDQTGTQLLPIDGTARGSVLVCDWDRDGRKDVIFAMGGEGELSANYNWPHINADPGWDRGFLFYRNIGTDADPVLAYPKWVADRTGQPIYYSSRPNLGSYVDWNGDGKPDFIAAEFENSIRYYENISGFTGEPVFADTSGVTIVRPFTAQMISGADAVDWNRDGDIDIITGQGHGGNGLRFYERDYINDFVNGTYPVVTVVGSQRGITVAQARSLPDGSHLNIPREVVSAAFDGFFYIESPDRAAGIRVEMMGHDFRDGDFVSVSGSILTNADGERYIAADFAAAVY